MSPLDFNLFTFLKKIEIKLELNLNDEITNEKTHLILI